MSAITPQTNLRLIRVDFGNTKEHTFDFADATAQLNYFRSCPYYQSTEYDNFTYQRNNSVIRFPAHIENLEPYNYVMYNNDAYHDKWFYAFIESMEYVNDNMTLIKINTDYIQTWMFDYYLLDTFIEREHVANDNIGKHTYPENLETGEFKILATNRLSSFNSNNCKLIIGATIDISYNGGTGFTKLLGSTYNGIPSGFVYYCFEPNTTGVATNKNWKTKLTQVDNAGKGDSIQTMFLAPLGTFTYDNDTGEVTESNNALTKMWDTFETSAHFPKIPANLDGYSPKNNKLYTSPYCYFLADNGSGGTAVYNIEDFNGYIDHDTEFNFSVTSSIVPSMSIMLNPWGYKGSVGMNKQFGLAGSKFPQCSWISDSYTNWLTKNAIQLEIGSNAMQGVFNIATKNLSGGAGAFSNLGDLYSQHLYHTMAPDTIKGNTNSGDVNYSNNNLGFTIYTMGIKKEYAEIIDNYFQMFGYQVNEVKTPNTKSRTYWNYIKTRNCNVKARFGNIPNEDLIEIAKLYNDGITFWHGQTDYSSSTGYLDYSRTNSIS